MSGKHPPSKDKLHDAPIFDGRVKPCVWMKAGVINFKLCERNYDCLNCAFDRALSVGWGQEHKES